MKKILILMVVLAAGLVGYNYVATGELKLMPGAAGSAEDQKVEALASELRAAASELAQAGRSAGLTGMDSSSQAAAALARIGRLEQEGRALARTLTEAGARARLEELLAEMEAVQGGR